jgi:hypothetical protein
MTSLPSPEPHSTASALTETPYETLITAWDQAHPATADPEWRHVLDELAHPHTTQAFHRLAGAAA